MITLRTDLRDPNAPAPRAQWAQLWRGDGTPITEAWEGLAGPPGNANGDTYPTRPGDRSHPSPPATVAVEDSRPVVVLAAAAVVATVDRYANESIARWFAPGTITAPPARRADGSPAACRAPRHIAADGSVLGCKRPESVASAAGVGALVLYLDGVTWRPAIVAGVA